MRSILGLSLALAFINGCGSSGDSDDDTTTAASTSAKSKLTINGAPTLNLGLTAVDTSAATMKVYGFFVAESSDCSNPIEVFSSSTGKEVDMMQSPEIGSGDLPQATYNCVILYMSDTITFTPKTTTGACTAGTEYDLDVFRPQGEMYKPSATLPDGTEVEGTVEEQKTAVYISSLSTSEGGDPNGNPFAPPTASTKNNGLKLSSPLVVNADTVGTLVLDTSGRVESVSGNCDMQPPQFGFE